MKNYFNLEEENSVKNESFKENPPNKKLSITKPPPNIPSQNKSQKFLKQNYESKSDKSSNESENNQKALTNVKDKLISGLQSSKKLKNQMDKNLNTLELERIKKKKSKLDLSNIKRMEELCDICDRQIRDTSNYKNSYNSTSDFKQCLEEIADISNYPVAPIIFEVDEKISKIFLNLEETELVYMGVDNIKMLDYQKVKADQKNIKPIPFPLPLNKKIDYLTMAPNGSFLIADLKHIMILDSKSKKVLQSFEHKLFYNVFGDKASEKVTHIICDVHCSIIAFSSNGPNKHKIGLFYPQEINKHNHLVYNDHEDCIKSLAFLPDGNRIISGHSTGKVIIWSLETAKELKTLNSQHKNSINAILVISNGLELITACEDEDIFIWKSTDSLNFEINPTLTIKAKSPVYTIYMFPNSPYLLAGTKEKLLVWNIKNGQKVCTFDGYKSAYITPDGKRLFSTQKTHLLIWDILNEKDVFNGNPHENIKNSGISQLLSIPDKDLIISSGRNQSIQIYDTKTDDIISKVDNIGVSNHVNPLAIFEDGSRIISLDKHSPNIMIIWDIKTGGTIHTLNYHKSIINSIVIGNEDSVYSMAADGFIFRWIVQKNKKYQREDFGNHKNNTILSICNQKLKSILASAGKDGSLKIWIDGQPVKTLNEHVQSVSSIVFLKQTIEDKIIMFSGGCDKKIVIWDAETWEKKNIITTDLDEIHALTIIEHDQTMKLIDVESQKLRVWNIDFKNYNILPIIVKSEDFFITAITTIKSKIFIGGIDDKIRILNIEKIEEKQVDKYEELTHVDKIGGFCVIKENYEIAIAIGKNIYMWDLKTKKSTQLLPLLHGSSIELLEISKRDTKYMVSAIKGEIPRLFLWNYEKKEFMQEIQWQNKRKINPKKKILPFPDFIEIYKNMLVGLIKIKSGKEKNESKLVLHIIDENKSNDDILLIPLVNKPGDLSSNMRLVTDTLSLGQIYSIKILEMGNEKIKRGVKIVTTGKISSNVRHGTICIYNIDIYEESDKKINVNFSMADLINTHEDIPLRMEFLPEDFDTVFSVNDNNTISIWNLGNDSCMARIKIDFEVKSISFLSNSDRVLGFINSRLFDFHNNQFLNVRKESNDKNSQIIHLKENDYILVTEDYNIEKHNNLFCTYNNLNILSSMNSLESLRQLYNNQFEEINKGIELIYPYYFNYLHLIAITGNKDLFCLDDLTKLQPNINVFMAENIFDKDCFDMTQLNKNVTNKETFKKLIDLFLKTLDDKNTLATDKARYFSNHLKENETDFKFLDKAFEYYGSETLEEFLNKTSLDFDSFVEGIELPNMKKPVDLILHSLHPINSSDVKNMLIVETLKNRQGSIKKAINWFKDRLFKRNKQKILLRAATRNEEENMKTIESYESNEILVNVKCKFICLENFVEINDQIIEFTNKILKLEPTDKLFCNKVLTTLINYKWNSYAFYIFLRQFILFIFMFLLYSVNFFYFYVERISDPDNISLTNEISSCCLDSILFIYFAYYLYCEFREFTSARLEYLESIYNWIDLSIVLFANAALILDVLYIFNVYDDITYLQKVISVSMFLFWMRIISYLRGLEGTSFMINLILQVIKDIKYFLLLMFLVQFAFDCAAYFLQSFGTEDSFNFFYIFTVFYRLLMGDFNQYDDIVVENSYFLWFIMLTFTVICVIVLLNLLISIISDSFQNVYKLKNQTRSYELMSLINDIDRQISDSSRQYLRDNAKIGNYLFRFYTEDVKEETNYVLETYNSVKKMELQMQDLMYEIKLLQESSKKKE